MQLNEIKNEKAVEVLAELIEPITEIATDKELQEFIEKKEGEGKQLTKAGLIHFILKRHKTAILHMLAILDEEDPESYNVSFYALPAKVINLFNDPLVQQLFFSQNPKKHETSFGSVSSSIEGRQ